MTRFAYDMTETIAPQIGVIALQSDMRIESDFRRLIPMEVDVFVSRLPSGEDVTPDSLAEMFGHLTAAARLFPRSAAFRAVGYGCTSGTATIGLERIASLVQAGTTTGAVSEPVSALIAACRHLNVRSLAILSPYIETVSARLRHVLQEHGIAAPAFGSFDEAEEARVVRIDPASVQASALDLAEGQAVDAVFLSCTNLNTLDVIAPLEAQLNRPVLSSNQVLAWHLLRLAQAPMPADGPGQLWADPADGVSLSQPAVF